MSVNPKDARRLFFALWPDDPVRAALSRVRDDFRPSVSGRWVPAANWHVTLAFLGEVPANRIEDVWAAGAAIRAPAFVMAFERPELWVRNGVFCLVGGKGAEAAGLLAAGLGAALEGRGWAAERKRFRPHLTLARKAEARERLRPLRNSVLWPMQSFCLVESVLEPSGARYQIVAAWNLQGFESMSGPGDMR